MLGTDFFAVCRKSDIEPLEPLEPLEIYPMTIR